MLVPREEEAIHRGLGLFTAIVTFVVAQTWLAVTNGPTGIGNIPRPEWFGTTMGSVVQYLAKRYELSAEAQLNHTIMHGAFVGVPGAGRFVQFQNRVANERL